MRYLLLSFAVFIAFQKSFAHSDFEGFARIRSGDCSLVVSGPKGTMTSIYVSISEKSAKVMAFNGPRSPIDFSVNAFAVGSGSVYKMVGFPNYEAETVVVKLDTVLASILKRPNLVLTAKIKNPNSEIPGTGYLSNPMNEDDDVELSCSMAFDETDEDLDQINPEYVQKAQHPSICAIQFRDNIIVKEWTHGCTAAVVGNKKLLSAAHCEELYGNFETRVRCGSDQEWNTIVKSKWTKNPAYRPEIHPVDNTRDISIVELAKPATGAPLAIEYSDTAIQGMILNNSECQHYGMGRRQDGSIGELYTSPYAFPDEELGGKAFTETLFKMTNMIASNPIRFLRNGDSGGPIICKNANGTEVIVGVHSFLSPPSSSAMSAMTSRSGDFIKSLIK